MLEILTMYSALILSFMSVIELGMDSWGIDSPLANMYLATSKQVLKPGSKFRATRQLQNMSRTI